MNSCTSVVKKNAWRDGLLPVLACGACVPPELAGAQFIALAAGSVSLPPGTVFTTIDNTSATAITGTFSHLADGSTITVDSDTFQANYEGGDGNDLTLTVVP